MRKGRKVKSCFAGTLLLLNVGISSVYAMDFPEKVLETLQCTEGEILVESEVIVPETPIHKGDVERVLFSLDNAKLLYGEEEDWIQSDEPGMWEVRGVPDQAKILAYLTDGGMGVCFELDASRLGKAEQRKVQEKEKELIRRKLQNCLAWREKALFEQIWMVLEQKRFSDALMRCKLLSIRKFRLWLQYSI